MDEIFALKSLAELEAYLKSKATQKVREKLAKTFLRCALYQNAEQWNKAVRLCEALAIVGWAEHEPVQAERGKSWNGNPATMFFNRFSQKRFVEADWSRRKSGLTMQQGCTWYHYSPDLPDRQSQGDDYKVRECIQDVRLTTQRNWIPKNPILLGREVSNCYSTSEKFVEDVERHLMPTLDEQMTPEHYGTAVNRIVIFFSLSYSDRGIKAINIILDEDVRLSTQELYKRLRKMYSKQEIEENGYYLRKRYDYGSFSSAKGTMRVKIHFPREFSEQSTRAQKKEFARHLREAVDGAIIRLKKKKMQYDFERMRGDFQRILRGWEK